MAAAQECQDKHRLLSSGWGYFMYRPARAKFIPSPLWCDLTPAEWLVRRWEHNPILHMQTATWLVSRELTDAAGAWDSRLLNNDDGEYFCRVLRASTGVRFVGDAKVFYRQGGSDRLSYVGRSNKKMEAHFLGIQLQMKFSGHWTIAKGLGRLALSVYKPALSLLLPRASRHCEASGRTSPSASAGRLKITATRYQILMG